MTGQEAVQVGDNTGSNQAAEAVSHTVLTSRHLGMDQPQPAQRQPLAGSRCRREIPTKVLAEVGTAPGRASSPLCFLCTGELLLPDGLGLPCSVCWVCAGTESCSSTGTVRASVPQLQGAVHAPVWCGAVRCLNHRLSSAMRALASCPLLFLRVQLTVL